MVAARVFSTGRAAIPVLLPTLDRQVPLVDLASCRTVQVLADVGHPIHHGHPGEARWKSRHSGCQLNPLFSSPPSFTRSCMGCSPRVATANKNALQNYSGTLVVVYQLPDSSAEPHRQGNLLVFRDVQMASTKKVWALLFVGQVGGQGGNVPMHMGIAFIPSE